MSNTIRYIGLDVHKLTITIAVADTGREKAQVVATIPNNSLTLLKHLLRLGARESLRCCYEAGPTGYGVYRLLLEHEIECVVIAPGLIPKKPGERIKTDDRDACKLAQSHRAGDLTSIYVVDEVTESMRDLARARTDAKQNEKVVRNQLGKFLLRHDRTYDEKTN